MAIMNKQICYILYQKGKWNLSYCQLCTMRNKHCDNLDYYNQQEALEKQRHDYEEDMRYMNEKEAIVNE